MENAGRNATDVLERALLGGSARGKRVTIVCGTGNNGGDGFVIARHLHVRGAIVDVALAGPRDKLSPDAKTNANAWMGLGGVLESVTAPPSFDEADAIVDALFGTGLDRPVEGLAREIVEKRPPRTIASSPSTSRRASTRRPARSWASPFAPRTP